MRRRLKPEERKRAIAEAVLSVTARGGLDAASVRDVAAEAGVSAGMVQHHFGTKDEMLLFACRYMVAKSEAAMRERMEASPGSLTSQEVLRGFFGQMIPTDDERRDEVRVWISFLARAAVEPDLASFMRKTHEASHRFVEDTIRTGQKNGEIPASLDPEREAISVFMLVEGLTSHVLFRHYTAEQALRAIDERLDQLFSGESSENRVP